MKVSDYPFNKDLLIGKCVSWIPEESSNSWHDYSHGIRWHYLIVGFVDNYLFSRQAIKLIAIEGTKSELHPFHYLGMDQLEIIG